MRNHIRDLEIEASRARRIAATRAGLALAALVTGALFVGLIATYV